MKRVLLLFFFASLLTLLGARELVVMTYNIRHGLGIDGVFSLERVIKTIKSANPDILFLNEVDQGNPRSGEQLQAKVIADALGMEYFFSPTEGRTDYGNAVLSKFPIRESFGFTLPQPKWMLASKRGCAAAVIDVEGREILVMATHLGLGGFQEVQVELREVYQVSKKKALPTIIGGDFNIEWFELNYAVPEIFEDFVSVNHHLGIDLHTIPSNNPGSQIDYILVTSHFVIRHAYTVSSLASDHLPVIAVVGLP